MPVLCTYSKMLLQEHFDVDSRLNLRAGELVVLRTRRGVEVGKVSAEPGTTRMRRDENTAGKVVRRAAKADRDWFQSQRTQIHVSKELREARRLGREMAIDCTFADVEHLMEEDRTVLYYVSEGRVDLGDLPKRLAEAVGHRVDFRQIGARDVARLSGDVGSCGEELCCKTFLVDFAPVSMKMAKNQGLGVDMAKISGMCGRLKCCLRYEDELYTTLRATMPKNGQPVTVNGEEGWVVSANLLTQTCLVEIAGKREEFPVASVVYDPKMSDGQIRRWQKDMREAKAAEYEARNQERDARKAAKDQQAKERMARASARSGRGGAEAAPEEPGDGDEVDVIEPDVAPLPDDLGAEGPEAEGEGFQERRREPSRRQPQNERRRAMGAAGHEGPRRGDGQRRGDGRNAPQNRPAEGSESESSSVESHPEDAQGASGGDQPRRSRGRRGGRGRGRGGPRPEGSGESPSSGGSDSGGGAAGGGAAE